MIRAGAILASAAAVLGPAGVLSQATPGLWELRRVPDGQPVRQCVADIAALAQVEQRGQACARKVVSSEGSSTVLRYSCNGGGFGQSTLTLLTPRSLTIETQGISGGLPFNYVVHARRVGDCHAR